jgi:hypothetical protein
MSRSKELEEQAKLKSLLPSVQPSTRAHKPLSFQNSLPKGSFSELTGTHKDLIA